MAVPLAPINCSREKQKLLETMAATFGLKRYEIVDLALDRLYKSKRRFIEETKAKQKRL